MKNQLPAWLLALVVLCSCGKRTEPDAPVGFPSQAETNPPFNNTNFGVYKGVLIGSSGHIIFRINNEQNEIKGFLSIDGRKDTLSTAQTVRLNQPIVDMKFAGRFSSLTLNVDARGLTPVLSSIRIDGHPGSIFALLTHENSDQLMTTYEGTFGAGGKGTIVLLHGDRNVGDTTGVLHVALRFTDNDPVLFAKNIPVIKKSFGSIVFGPDLESAKVVVSGTMQQTAFTGQWKFTDKVGSGRFSGKRTY